MGLTDAGFYEVVVDLVGRVLGAGCLDDVDVLPTDGLLDLASALADLELGEGTVALGYTQEVADIVDELWVGVAPEDDEIADHLCSVVMAMLGIKIDGATATTEKVVLDRYRQFSREGAQVSAGPRSRSGSWAADVTKVAEDMRGKKREGLEEVETRRDNTRGKSPMGRRSKRPAAGCLREYCHRGIIVSKSDRGMNEERGLRGLRHERAGGLTLRRAAGRREKNWMQRIHLDLDPDPRPFCAPLLRDTAFVHPGTYR